MTQPSRRQSLADAIRTSSELLAEAAERRGYQRGRREATADIVKGLLGQAGINNAEMLRLVGQLRNAGTPADPGDGEPDKPISIPHWPNGQTPEDGERPMWIPGYSDPDDHP